MTGSPGSELPPPRQELSADSVWVVVGRIRGAFGVHGVMRVEPLSGSPEESVLRKSRSWRLRDRAGVERPLRLSDVRVQGGELLAVPKEPLTREEILALKGMEVLLPRSEFPPLPQGEYYWFDLTGCRVVNQSGLELGDVQEVDHHGAHALLCLVGGSMIPFVGIYILDVNLAERRILVDWEPDWA